jgi:hypothetical protein
MVAAISAIAHAISADSWGWRSAFLGVVGFAMATLVGRGIAGIRIGADAQKDLMWRVGISRAQRWLWIFGAGVVAGLVLTIGEHHPWPTTAIRVVVLAIIWAALYVGVEKVHGRDPSDASQSDREGAGSE